MEEDIFENFYKTYFKYVYRYLYSLTFDRQRAEDLTQEVFVKALCQLDFPNNKIKTWLLTVAHNLYVDYLRKNKRLEYKEEDFFKSQVAEDIHNSLEEKETFSTLVSNLRILPETQRQVVILCLINELTYEEVSQIMGVSVSAVTNLIYRARKTLRALRRHEE